MFIKPFHLPITILALSLIVSGPLVWEVAASHCDEHGGSPCVGEADIQEKAIKSDHIGGNQIKTRNIKKGAVTSKKISNGGVKEEDVEFNYAASTSEGGNAIFANNADLLDGHNSDYYATAGAVLDLIAKVAALDTELDTAGATIATLESDLVDAEATIAALETDLAIVQADSVPGLGDYVSVQSGDINEISGPHILFTGANVHVRSGSGETDDGADDSEEFVPLGQGNLIVGYNELRSDFGDTNDRTGSHNLIVGKQNNFTSYGGFVAGVFNTISGGYASVSGGKSNEASGNYASVSGGYSNTASGYWASVSGGDSNTASATYASVSGGAFNTASGGLASVSGGLGNEASGYIASVGGGQDRTAGGTFDWVAGSLFEDF